MPAEEEAILDYVQILLCPCAVGTGTFCLHKVGLWGSLVVFQEVSEYCDRKEGTDSRKPAGDIL